MDTALAILFQGFLLSKEADGCKETTLETYRVMYRSLVTHLDIEDAQEIEPQHLYQWAISLESYAPATRDQRIAKCKTFFTWCHKQGFLDINPAAALKRPRKTWQPDPLTEADLHLLLEQSRKGRAGLRNHAMVCVLLDSGIRNTELCYLSPEDLDLRTGQLRIRRGKGGKARTVLVGKRSKQALWRWLMVRPPEAPTLFCTEQGNPLTRIRVRVIISNIGKRCGVHAYPHRLRHTFALQYLKLGGNGYSLQYLLGHEDMTTVREYVKLASQDVSQMYKSPLDAL